MKQEKIEQLKEFAQLLKEKGFTVLIDNKHPFHWVYFEKGGRFGDVQDSGYSGFNFGSAYIPCRSHGTGRQVDRNVGLSIEYATNAINEVGWSHSPEIERYQGIADFIKRKNKDGFAEFYVL